MLSDICSAIEIRTMLIFYFDGSIRYVEPYCFGERIKGKSVLRAY